MPPNHEIVITNFKSDETVYYPLIIIKGIVKNINDCQNGTKRISVDSNFFKIINGKFKALVELDLGQNEVVLNYCCLKISLNVNYQRRPTQFCVLPLYIVCNGHDGKFQAPETEKNDIESASRRITLGSKLLQTVIAEKLYEENQGRKTFQLEDDCQIFYSNLDYLVARRMSQEELWNYIGSEIMNSSQLYHERLKFLGFLSCTKYRGQNYREGFSHEDILKITEAYVALGGGGFALFGTACLYTWPECLSQVMENFENSTQIDKKYFMDDSNYRGTLAACFSTTLGSVLHELCHTFDLGHTETGIMGRGFDDIYKVFTVNEDVKEDLTFWTKSCLFLLAYHKWFNDYDSVKNKIIKFDPVSKFVSANAGLRVIEVRKETNGMVLFSWVFDSRILKYSFQLPENLDFGQNYSVIMVVEDNNGNIFKCGL